jgi:hypothetical protein
MTLLRQTLFQIWRRGGLCAGDSGTDIDMSWLICYPDLDHAGWLLHFRAFLFAGLRV